MKMAFLLMTEPLKYQQVYTLLRLVDAAQKKGHEITGIFLFSTGVLNIKKRNKLGKDVRNIPMEFNKLAESGVPIYVCQTWADNFGIFKEDTFENVHIGGIGELSNIFAAADKCITFGMNV